MHWTTKIFPLIKQCVNDPEQFITQGNHGFSVLHHFLPLFKIVHPKVSVKSHYSTGHKIKTSPQGGRAPLAYLSIPLDADPRVGNRRVTAYIGNKTSLTFKTINTLFLCLEMRCNN